MTAENTVATVIITIPHERRFLMTFANVLPILIPFNMGGKYNKNFGNGLCDFFSLLRNAGGLNFGFLVCFYEMCNKLLLFYNF